MQAKKRILIAEDDQDTLGAMMAILRADGYTVTALIRGDSLLDGDFGVPDLFILDNKMARVDGLDICRHLKAQSSTASTPVLIISADPVVATQAVSAGASGFLEKPFNIKSLRNTVRQLIAAEL